MNEYLIAIYQGKLEGDNDQVIKSIAASMGISIQHLHISSANISLVLVEKESKLTIGNTDEYFLLTQALQQNIDNNNIYYVYDYRSRKEIERPTQNFHSLMKLKTSITRLQSVIQNVKDIKYKVFAVFEVIYVENTNFLLINVLLSSELLNNIDRKIISETEIKEYNYLERLTEVLSSSNITTEVLTCSIPSFTIK
jgi:hypothetical protein